MSYPPMIIHLRIPKEKGGHFGLWIPIFLLYPFILAFALILLPFVLLAALLALPMGKARQVLLTGPLACRVFWNLRGLKVDIREKSKNFLINVR